MLRIARYCIAFMELMGLAENFISLSTLHLYKMDMVTDDGLHALLMLPSLTHVDLGGRGYTHVGRIRDVGMDIWGG